MKQKTPGQSLSEYGLIIALVALLCVPALFLLKDSLIGGFSGMLPAPNTQNPNITKLLQNGKPPNTDQDITMGGGTNNIVVIGTGSSFSAVVLQPISTAGANGNSARVLANSSKILAIVAKYSQTSPELSNSIVQLGQLGQQMGQTIASNDRSATMEIWGRFTNLYSQILTQPNSYEQLKPEDQALIKTLTNQSSQLTATFTGFVYSGREGFEDFKSLSPQTVGASAKQVQDNSSQTVQCGQNLKCN